MTRIVCGGGGPGELKVRDQIYVAMDKALNYPFGLMYGPGHKDPINKNGKFKKRGARKN